jgi:AbiV family abortive infection protein
MSVTPQYLLQGAAYALEQCGLLLRDANVLYRSHSYASAVVLTAFAREELGRSEILLDLRRQASAGKTFTIAQIRDACEDHVIKQRTAMLSIVTRADRDSGLGKLLRARMENHPQSPEWRKADVELKQIDETKKKRTPSDRHEKRIAALYVEPISESEWNRPATISASTAHDFLQDAVNDYAGRYGQGYITSADSILRHVDPELYSALEQWSDRPELQPPEWPPYPGSQQAEEGRATAVQRWRCSLIAHTKALMNALRKRTATILAAIFRRNRAQERDRS